MSLFDDGIARENKKEMEARYKIGQEYKSRGKAKYTCTVVDILKTYNSKGEVVKLRYVSTHEFCGQVVTDSDVPETAITMGLL